MVRRSDLTAWSAASRSTTTAGRPGSSTSTKDASIASAPGWWRWRGTPSRRPRLLLNSACPQFPDGLCNDFDQVGRYVMVQGAPQTTGRYDEEIRSYKAPPPECSSEAFYETDPTKSYKRGFSLAVHLAVADRLRRACVRTGTLGRDAARIHA